MSSEEEKLCQDDCTEIEKSEVEEQVQYYCDQCGKITGKSFRLCAPKVL